MTTLLAGMQNCVLVLESSKSGWKINEKLKATHPQSIVFDRLKPGRAYCGTFGDGLWQTDDNGQTWNNVGKDEISPPNIMSVSVSHLSAEEKNKKNDESNNVYVGTEPSRLYISSDGCKTWERMNALNDLKSSSSWSFPPRPWTSHVRWIEPDINNPNYVFVAIEAGALVKSHDGGRTWIDKVKQSPYDAHSLATHKKAPKRVYSSAGDGFFESFDYGESWNRFTAGLHHQYLHGLAVDSTNPQNVIVSASLGAWQAHYIERADSFIYRRSDDSENWRGISNGFPESKGTLISILCSNPIKGGEFYALNNRGIFSSTDSGISWQVLDDIEWSKEYLSQHPWTLAVGNNY